MGDQLLPIFQKVIGKLSQVVQWFTDLSPRTQKIILGVAAAAAVLGPFLVVLSQVVGIVMALRTAYIAFTASQWALNIAMSANPIGLIVIGIAALIAIIVLLVVHWDTVKAAMISFGAAFRDKLGIVVDYYVDKFKQFVY